MRRTLTLDGLRGIAVVAVLVEHAWPELLPGGFGGVDVFFVLSGFLITGLLLRELGASGRIDLVAFYARRIRRILPASLLTVLVTCLLYLGVFAVAMPQSLRWEAVSAALSYSNFVFLGRTVDYFAAAPAGSPFLHFWSLAVEEQFYLVWPGLLLALSIVAGRIGGRVGPWVIPAAVVVLAVGSLWLALFARQTFAFYMLPARAWELAVGGGLAILDQRGRLALPASLRSLRLAGAVAGFGMLGLGLVLAPELGRWPGPATVLPVVGTALLVAGGDGVPGGAILRLAWLRFLGRISYALYLWHWPLLAIASLVVLPVVPIPPQVALVAVLAAGVVATGSTLFMEEPIRASRRRLVVGRPGVAVGLASALGVAVLAYGTIRWAPSVVGGEDAVGRAALAARTDTERIVRDACITRMADAELLECVYGVAAAADGGPTEELPTDAPVVVLFGDSHASHWFPAVDAWARARGFALVPILRSACPPVDAPIPDRNQVGDDCATFRALALARMAELRPVLTIVSGSLGSGIVLDGEVVNPRRDSARWVGPATRMLVEIAGRSPRTVLLGDVPMPRFSVPDCVGAHRSEPLLCARPLEAVQAASLRADEALAAAEAGVAFIDPTDWLCSQSCTWMIDGRLTWRDPQHLSTVGAMSALAPLSAALDEVLER